MKQFVLPVVVKTRVRIGRKYPLLFQKATKKGDPSDKRYNESGNNAPLYQRNILERDENNRQSINQTFQSGGPSNRFL